MLLSWKTLGGALVLAGCVAVARDAPAEAREYDIAYAAHFVPERGIAEVTLTVDQSRDLLRLLDFNAPAERYQAFAGDGEIERQGDRVHWQPPATGGTLRFEHRIDHRRDDGFDARIEEDWVVTRLDDLFPPARSRTLAGAESRASLELSGPESWSIETPYGPMADEPLAVRDPDRRYDRPSGWMIGGELGIRRDIVGGRRVAVAAPVDQDVHRNDLLALIHWTMPELLEVFPMFPERLLVVSARDDMWQGALSGPRSLYIHAGRPGISGNGTSTLVHELVHVASGMSAAPGEDWIVEGLAEYYSLELLRRSGTISRRRYRNALEDLAEWAEEADGLAAKHSTGARTALAVGVMAALDAEIVDATDGGASLDAVAAELARAGDVGSELLARLAAEVLGRPSEALSDAGIDT